MSKPAKQVVGADAHEDVADALTESLSCSVTETAQVVFDEAPAGLYGAEVGRIGRQEYELRALGFDQLAHDRCVMRAEVVEHDDVAGVETRAKAFSDVFDEAGAVDWTDEGLVAEHAVVAHRPDD